MSYQIKQAVGNLSGGSHSVSVTITPAAGSLLWLIGVGASEVLGASFSDSVSSETVSAIGSETAISGSPYSLMQAFVENVTGASHTITISNPNSYIAGLVVVEIAGLKNAAPLGSWQGTATTSGSASPWTTSSGNPGSIGAVPAAVLAFAIDSNSNPALVGAGAGFNADAITWQGGALGTSQQLLEDMRLTSAGSPAATFSVNQYYDSYGIAVAVFQEAASSLPVGGHGFARATATANLVRWAQTTLTAPLYTGIGSVADPNFWPAWASELIEPGTVFYYDPTYLTILPDGEIVSSADNVRSLVAFRPIAGGAYLVGEVFIPPASGLVSYGRARATSIAILHAATSLGVAHAYAKATAIARALSTASWDSFAYINGTYSQVNFSWEAPDALHTMAIGLSTGNSAQTNTTLNYGIETTGTGTVEIYESGALVGSFGTYSSGDQFAVNLDGTNVTYLHNGVLLRTTPVTGGPFYPVFCFYSAGSKAENVTLNTEYIS